MSEMLTEKFVLRIPLNMYTADTAERVADLIRDLYRFSVVPSERDICSIFNFVGLEVELVGPDDD